MARTPPTPLASERLAASIASTSNKSKLPTNTKKRNLRPEDLYTLKTVSDPRVSPDGKRVAYVLTSNDRDADEAQSSIYVAPRNGRGAAKRFSFGNKDTSPRWSPNGEWLAFVAKRGEEDQNQLFVSPLDGGDSRQLTNATFGVAEPAWAPDSSRITYVARTGDFKETKDRSPVEKAAPKVIQGLAYKLDGIGFFDQRRQHVFSADLESGKETQLTDGDWDDTQPSWSPDGAQIVFISDRQAERHDRHWRRDVWSVAASGGRARKLTRSRGGANHPVFSPDGSLVAFVGHESGEDLASNRQLFVVPADAASPPRSVTQSLDRTVVGDLIPAETFAWTSDSRSLTFIAGSEGTQSLYLADLASGSIDQLAAGNRWIESISPTPDPGRAVLVESSPSRPMEVMDIPLGENSAQSRNLSRANDGFVDTIELAVPGRISHTAADGLEIESLVLNPPGFVSIKANGAQRQKPGPLALEIHGGPHGVNSAAFNIAQQSLAAAGYTVLLPNPRGSTSYGADFTRGVIGDWGGKDFQDILGAVDSMVESGVADERRLYVGGYSYGGFMTSWTVGHTDRFQAAALGAPVANLFSMFGTSDIPLFMAYEIDSPAFGNPEPYRTGSPVTYLEKVRTPVLLYHNEGDLRCPVAQSEEIFQGLRALGREVEYVRYPGGFHGVSTPSQLIDRMVRKLDWYGRHKGVANSPKRAKAKTRQPVTA